MKRCEMVNFLQALVEKTCIGDYAGGYYDPEAQFDSEYETFSYILNKLEEAGMSPHNEWEE